MSSMQFVTGTVPDQGPGVLNQLPLAAAVGVLGSHAGYWATRSVDRRSRLCSPPRPGASVPAVHAPSDRCPRGDRQPFASRKGNCSPQVFCQQAGAPKDRGVQVARGCPPSLKEHLRLGNLRTGEGARRPGQARDIRSRGSSHDARHRRTLTAAHQVNDMVGPPVGPALRQVPVSFSAVGPQHATFVRQANRQDPIQNPHFDQGRHLPQ